MEPRPQPPLHGTLALAELRRQDESRGVNPRTLPVTEDAPPAPAPPHITELIPAPDWQAEERERLERERREQTRIAEEELRRIGADSERAAPAPPRRSAARALVDELKGTRR